MWDYFIVFMYNIPKTRNSKQLLKKKTFEKDRLKRYLDEI